MKIICDDIKEYNDIILISKIIHDKIYDLKKLPDSLYGSDTLNTFMHLYRISQPDCGNVEFEAISKIINIK